MRNGEWRSLVARAVWDREVAGSNPVSPTNEYCIEITLPSDCIVGKIYELLVLQELINRAYKMPVRAHN